ncbi:hypothetical protein M409DRAFT_68722 [Zasmidium cellare ATCC 36951]|uniref:Enoyl reductase (ER) domain-containing protein n=1 Tax=Zasmidium cellare ATCC 36951 TaxID=1080233 RepID=A0A6A6C7S9_ZASCE|nr:uncharacterized protein M409DRAFT_68722 [Zasmidium cellare ATCC 36951]KAF2163095.1 hypothetical protein M409DRAFT_68722 [Zasmidium cellare ATCC 36951]
MSSQAHTLNTYCFKNSRNSFAPKTTTKSLGFNDILIKTTHSGICFTDVHAKSKECGLGHEGVGHIVEVGPAVRQLSIGDRVGWGWLHTSCGHCKTCVTGYRQYCSEARGFAFSDLDQGAFGDFRIIDAEFAYKLPNGISSVHAAPLMCAGASVYEALDAAGTKAGDRVGIVGLGGLGHMGVLFARAMACGVTVISNSMTKIPDAWKLGADEFRYADRIGSVHRRFGAVDEPNSMNIDVLLVTSNAVPKLETVLPLLARRATVVLMTIQQESLVVPYMQFVLPGHRLIASTEASRENHIKMLEFADRHQIKPWVEVFDMDATGLKEAFEKLESGNMRYRGVLQRSNSLEL